MLFKKNVGFILSLVVISLIGSLVVQYIVNKYVVPRTETHVWKTSGTFNLVTSEKGTLGYIRDENDPLITYTTSIETGFLYNPTVYLYIPQDYETVAMDRYYLGWSPTHQGFYFSVISKPGMSLPEMVAHNLKMAMYTISLLFLSFIFKLSVLLLV